MMRIPPVFALLTTSVVTLAIATAACGPNRSADPGAQLFQTKGCASCHGSDGEGRVGPALTGLFGTEITVLDPDGEPVTVKADAEYLRQSIVDPSAYVVEGFQTPMPPANLTPEELDLLVGYIESLGTESSTTTTTP